MRALGIIRSLFGFLTVIPVGGNEQSFETTAHYMFLFPLVGALIGGISGAISSLLLAYLPSALAGFLSLAVILMLTGLQHTDGLLDLGDGLFYHGAPEEKIQAMRDPRIGAGGLVIGFIVLSTTALAISSIRPQNAFAGLLVAEVNAKLSMVVAAAVGRSAQAGMNTPFIKAMHGRNGFLRLLTALLASALLILLASEYSPAALLSIIASITVTLMIVSVSHRNFNGITGDVFGAINDMSRATTLILILLTLR